MLYTTERQSWIGCDHLVDEHYSGLDSVDELLLFGRVVRPGACSQPKWCFVRNVNRFCDVTNSKEHGDRTKQFFPIRRTVPIDVRKYRRHVIVSRSFYKLAPGQYLSATADEALNLSVEILYQLLRGKRTDFGSVIHRIAHL